MKQVCVRLDDETAKKLKISCAKKETTAQEVIKGLIEKWIKENDK